MPGKAENRAEAYRLRASFANAGATPVEADVLQPAGTLLDLYGEDIRARAYVTSDPIRGEVMLRPDFTVPLALEHLQNGAGAARYCYAGEVFRRQEEPEPARAAEYFQAGLELFDQPDAAAADAEVFSTLHNEVAPLGLRAAMGDIGLLIAAVEGLDTTGRRKAALLRHLWRPRRFRALIDRYSGCAPVPPSRLALLSAADGNSVESLIAAAGPHIGRRSTEEIATRVAALQSEAVTPKLADRDVSLLEDLLSIRAAPMDALERLRDIAVDMRAIEPALARYEARLEALNARGIDLETIEFEAAFGRTSLEYYDGFVFGFYAPGRADLPPVASGGRYDALCRVLGQGRETPAVGGVIRPGLMLELAEEGGR